MGSVVAYYRVSTGKQGLRGLGMEAQADAVRRHASSVGATIVAEYTEVESGKRSDRPELTRALTHARRCKATLYVAKLDRLSRNVAFLSALMESKVEFIACDNPHATSFTLHVLAAVAEHEARCISERTKAALAAYKARGGVLGTNRPGSAGLTPEVALRGSQVACRASRLRAAKEYEVESAIAASMRAAGSSLSAIAERLNSEGRRTIEGALFSKVQIHRMLMRLA